MSRLNRRQIQRDLFEEIFCDRHFSSSRIRPSSDASQPVAVSDAGCVAHQAASTVTNGAVAVRHASASFSHAVGYKEVSALITSPPARRWTKFEKTTSKSFSVSRTL